MGTGSCRRSRTSSEKRTTTDRCTTSADLRAHIARAVNDLGKSFSPQKRCIFSVMGITTTALKPIEQTAFLTQYARALDSRSPRPILGDAMANDVVAKIDYDFRGLGLQTSVVCQTALRAKMLDDRVRDFVGRTPRRRRRRSRRRTRRRLLPGVTTVVRGLVQRRPARASPHCATRCCLPTGIPTPSPVSLADEHWPESIPADRPTILIADGLFAFLSEPVIAGIFRRITGHFGSGELAFNDYGGIGWVSRRCDQALPAEDVQGHRKPVGLRRFQGCPPSTDVESEDAGWSRRPASPMPPKSTSSRLG